MKRKEEASYTSWKREKLTQFSTGSQTKMKSEHCINLMPRPAEIQHTSWFKNSPCVPASFYPGFIGHLKKLNDIWVAPSQSTCSGRGKVERNGLCWAVSKAWEKFKCSLVLGVPLQLFHLRQRGWRDTCLMAGASICAQKSIAFLLVFTQNFSFKITKSWLPLFFFFPSSCYCDWNVWFKYGIN